MADADLPRDGSAPPEAGPSDGRGRDGRGRGLVVRHVFTDRSHGDLAVGGDPSVLATRRRSVPGVPDAPWVWLEQVHGADVVFASEPGQHAGSRADAVVVTAPEVPVAVHTADCAPLLIVARGGVAVVHAGWRGLLAGVVDTTLSAMADLGLVPEQMVLGPVIRPRCYEFASSDLEPLVERFGPTVRSTTGWGTPALDVAAAISVIAVERGLALHDRSTCTACSPSHWSHRARGDLGRQALVAWLEPEAPLREPAGKDATRRAADPASTVWTPMRRRGPTDPSSDDGLTHRVES